MVDPNMPPLPPGFVLDAPQAPAFGGRPVIQQMPTPQDQAQLQHTQQQIAAQPLQNENTRVNIEQGQQSLATNRAGAIDKARDGYRQDKRILTFEAAIPIAMSALSAPENGAGDNMLVNAAAKVGDPSTGVQQREGASWEGSQPELDAAKAHMLKQFGSDGYGNFTPEGRTKIREAIRQRAKFLAKQYDSARQDHAGYIKSLGLPGVDVEAVLGPNAYTPFAADEEAYITAHGGTPKVDGVPVGGSAPDPTEHDTGVPSAPQGQEFHDSLYSALSSKQIKTPAEVLAFTRQFNQQNGTNFNVDFHNKETRLAIRAAMQGKPFGVENLPDPRVIAKANELKQKGGSMDAAAVGATDAITLGSADEIAAAGAALKGSLGGQGSVGDLYGVNEDANLIYQRSLQGDHPVAYGAGQLAGGLIPGLALPGSNIGQVVKGGAALGGAYGFNSGEGLSDRLSQGAMGAGAGSALGYAIPKGLSMIPGRGARAVPPLVDPATGELNQPMDATRPAERVQSMRDYGMESISPGMAGGRSARVVEQGLNNLPGSAGHMEDVNSAASKELRRSMQGVAQQFGSSKTLNEGGSELQRGAKEWMTRFDGVTSKAYNAIPISPSAPTSLNNTKATLEQLAGKLESNPALQEELRDGNLLNYLDAINKHGLSWNDLKDFRTFVGNKIGQFRLSEDARTSDYRSLYAALSEDMRSSASAQGPQALHAFDRANSLYREGQQRIDQALSRILGPDTQGRPELAAAAIQAMTKGGKSSGDLRTLAQVKAATVKSGAWDEIASTLIHLGGQPANSEGRAFQPATFVNWYADMAEPARAMLFKPELRKSLDGFVSMTQQLGRIRGLNNTSNTASSMFGGTTVLTAAAAILNPILGLKLAGTLAANYGVGKLWTNSTFVNLITGYGRAVASGNQNAVKSQVGRLSKLAATNPELRAPIESLLKRIANDNAVPSLAASSGPEGDQNQQ